MTNHKQISDNATTIQHREQTQAMKNNSEAEQLFNQAVIKLAVLLYQIDGKVSLTEQDYLDSYCENMDWNSGIVLPAFINSAIHLARHAIDTNSTREYLFSLGADLNIDPAEALSVAMDITAVDGKRSEDELELLSLLSNRVLARGLVA